MGDFSLLGRFGKQKLIIGLMGELIYINDARQWDIESVGGGGQFLGGQGVGFLQDFNQVPQFFVEVGLQLKPKWEVQGEEGRRVKKEKKSGESQ